MKLTYGRQTIDLFSEEDFPDGPPEQIFLGLSGGLDSSALLYLICTHFPNIDVVPYAGNDAFRPMDYLNAINVNQWFMERFDNVQESKIFKFDADEEQWVNEAKELIAAGKKPGFTSVRGLAKTLAMNKNINELQEKYAPNSICISGMTSNPPEAVMKDRDFLYNREPRRDKGQNHPVLDGKVYKPFINVDKLFVAGVYNDYGLMDELFELTGSCIGTPNIQNEKLWGTGPCKQCWWCKEKEWAFGKC